GHGEEGHRDRERPGASDRSRRPRGQDPLTRSPRRPARIVLVVAVVVAAALAVKAAAQFFLSGRPPVELLGGPGKFLLVENSGAFFGLGGSLSEGFRRTIFVLLVGAALVGALAWLIAASRLSRLRTIALAMMIGGGIANWLDRIADGRVTDYVVLS